MTSEPPAPRPTARELGLGLGTVEPGPLNAITDVPGVRVGHVTVFSGSGSGAARTGVTAILPHPGNLFTEKVKAAVHVINAFGKLAGSTQVNELGEIETPIVLINTLQVGTAWNAIATHALTQNPELRSVNPVVGECNDSYLNDIRGRHLREEDVLRAIESASDGSVVQGVVGAGTGMTMYGGWKGGIGTASRRLSRSVGGYTLGVLVLANFGCADELTIDGVHIGRRLKPSAAMQKRPAGGSVIIVVATDAPAHSRQLARIARRVQGGLACTGTPTSHQSGEFVLAFSTASRIIDPKGESTRTTTELVETGSSVIDELFLATVEGTEEAVINALFTADTVVGRDGNLAPGFPADAIQSLLA